MEHNGETLERHRNPAGAAMARGSRIGRTKRTPRRAASALAKMQGFALDMEEPLNEIENLAQALRFIGFGLESNDHDSGSPISALAWTAVERVAALRAIWRSMIKASAGA
jgi:hypothetical protein